MHVLLVTFGSLGDIIPFLSLGRALRGGGHRVSVVTSANFQEEVAAADLDFIELIDGPTMIDALTELDRAVNNADQFAPECLERLFTALFERSCRVIEEYHVPGETVACVRTGEVGSLKVCQRLGVPFVRAIHTPDLLKVFQPFLPGVPYWTHEWLFNTVAQCTGGGRHLKRVINAACQQSSLPPVKSLSGEMLLSPDLNVALFPAWYANWYRGALPGTLLTDFPLYERPNQPLAPQLEQFLADGDPPVVFSNASWRSGLDEFRQVVTAACRGAGCRGIVLRSGPLRELAPGVLAVDFVPLGPLLRRAAALVHHGGIGTVSHALAAAVPQIIVPYLGDHFIAAQAVRRLGVGLSLPARSYGSRMTTALRRVLDSQPIRGQCALHAHRLAGGPDFRPVEQRMVQLLEERAANGKPR